MSIISRPNNIFLPRSILLPATPSLAIICREQQKLSHTGYDTAFAGFGYSILHVAGFLSLHPAMKGYVLDNLIHTPTVGKGPSALDVHLKDPIRGIFAPATTKSAIPAPLERLASSPQLQHPHRLSENKAIPGIIFCASLISVSIVAALIFGGYAQGSSLAGHGSSQSGGDGSEQSSSTSNDLGEFNPYFLMSLSDLAF